MMTLRIALPLGLLVIAATLALLWLRADARADRLDVDLRTAQAAEAGLKKRNDQLERAALARVADDQAIDKLGKDLNDAIKNVPANETPSAASVALGCQRLRAAGATASSAFQRICSGH